MRLISIKSPSVLNDILAASKRRDGRVITAVCASRADVHSHVSAVSSGRSRIRFPGYFKEGFYSFLSSRQVNACRSKHQAIAYRSLVRKLPQHRPAGTSRGARRRGKKKKFTFSKDKVHSSIARIRHRVCHPLSSYSASTGLASNKSASNLQN